MCFHITLHIMLERIWEWLWKEFEQLLNWFRIVFWMNLELMLACFSYFSLYTISIQFPGKMQSLCQEECEVDVSILLRSRCQNEFQIMRSLCQEECEADVKILGSRARICWISISTELGGKLSRASRVGKYPVQVVWECVPCKLGGTRSYLTQTENVPTQLARDTFPPYWHGTRSHTTLMGHVPT